MTEQDFDHEELSPEQRAAMEIRLKELCLDCFGDGWVYYPAFPAKATCEACNGTGKVTEEKDMQLPSEPSPIKIEALDIMPIPFKPPPTRRERRKAKRAQADTGDS